MAQSTIIVLFIIAFSLILLNLILTIRLIRVTRSINVAAAEPQPLLDGSQLPQLQATLLSDNSAFDYQSIAQEAKVYLFLSSHCSKCKTWLPDIEKLHTRTQNLGVSIWLLTDEEPNRVRRFLQGTSLSGRVLLVDKALLVQFNPLMASPYYLFIDQENTLQAQGALGDENWLSFIEQASQEAA